LTFALGVWYNRRYFTIVLLLRCKDLTKLHLIAGGHGKDLTSLHNYCIIGAYTSRAIIVVLLLAQVGAKYRLWPIAPNQSHISGQHAK